MGLATINGGLALMLANNTRDGKIIYGVLVGVSACLYTAFVLSKPKSNLWGSGKRSRTKGNKPGIPERETEQPSLARSE